MLSDLFHPDPAPAADPAAELLAVIDTAWAAADVQRRANRPARPSPARPSSPRPAFPIRFPTLGRTRKQTPAS